MFSYALDDEKVRINKRLFLTATPRHIDIRKRDKAGDFRVHSMDDESLYGPRAYTLSFGAAANKDIIRQYKVTISLIDKQMVDDFSRNNGITLVEGDEISARWVSPAQPDIPATSVRDYCSGVLSLPRDGCCHGDPVSEC
jgi:predicted helicase